MKLASIILELSKKEPNDYSLGYKVRKVLDLHQKNQEIKIEDITKEIPKP